MKTDYLNAKILSHRANLQRYATLLATQLTELEREYLHKRIEEERAEVASLEFARAAEAARTKETVTVPNPLPPHASLPVPEPAPGECLSLVGCCKRQAHLAPPHGGAFSCGRPPRGVQPMMRLGVGEVGLPLMLSSGTGSRPYLRDPANLAPPLTGGAFVWLPCPLRWLPAGPVGCPA